MTKSWKPADIPFLEGKRILITGGNSGIGYHAALKLARKGADIVLACRNQQRGEAALKRLDSEAPGTNVELAILDLSSLASVHNFAAAQLAQRRPLHILINNAGVFAPPKRLETADGFEMQFGTNVLGHFALTALLMPALLQAAAESPDSPRIITIASIAHQRGRIDFGDLQSAHNYGPMRAYQQSKLANLILALELDRRLRAANSRILSIAAHPGVANTNLFLASDLSPFQKTMRSILNEIVGVVFNTDSDGALPTLYAATSPDAQPGGYYGPTGIREMRGDTVGPSRIAPQAKDPATAARLWQVCENLTSTKLL
jgi:NAD(P)-dependent dehydrogenase (short-subunit alcohol dehydrogenase family)